MWQFLFCNRKQELPRGWTRVQQVEPQSSAASWPEWGAGRTRRVTTMTEQCHGPGAAGNGFGFVRRSRPYDLKGPHTPQGRMQILRAEIERRFAAEGAQKK